MRRHIAIQAAAAIALALLPAPALPFDADAELPQDPAVTKGMLDNGLVYIIRENGRPEHRAELRLVVKAGSVDEDDDQRGLAHFLEHMLFNGTESWAGNEIIDYLETIGADFGADLNAYTSFDQTVYLLEIPTDRPGLLEDGIKILGEFAWKATLVAEEIEKERGVVLDEWRRGLGARQRVRDEQLPVILQGSRYAERLPIGLPEVIEGADPEAIRRFYRDWYRPERMAVIAVGDFDAAETEDRIRETFGQIPATDELRERTDWPVPAHADTLLAIADDPELGGTSVGISTKRPPPDDAPTHGAYRRDLVERATLSMFNSRLAELARSDDPPFLGAGMGVRRLGRTVEMTSVSARVPDGEEVRGLDALVTQAQRALVHGFTESELERTRSNLLAGVEAAWAERDKTPSGGYVSEYTRHFLEDEPIPGIDAEVRLWREILPGITVEECHAAFVKMSDGSGVVVEATRPSGPTLVGGGEMLEAIQQATARTPEPWADAAADARLIAAPLPPGEVRERREIADLGVTEVVLSNGVRVYLKPTDFQDDEVRFTGSALGGTSVVPDETLASASNAASIARESGWGGHSAVDLGKILAGKVLSVSPFFDVRQHGVGGSSTVADLETALEVVVLVMTAPNRDEAAFERLLDRMRARLANRGADPATRYHDRIVAINTSDHPRRRPMTVERLGEIDLDAALAFYRRSFENAADFAFFFAGNLDVDAVLPVLERTLGSLPSKGGEASAWVDREVTFPREPVREVVRAGSEPKGQTSFNFASYGGSDPLEWHRLRTACSILERRLRESLREELGATYGVSVGYYFSMIGPARGRVGIGFGSDPAREEELLGRVESAIEELRRDGPAAEEVAKEKEIQTRDMETSLRRNGFWIGSLSSLHLRDRPFVEMARRMSRIEELNVEDLHRVFREHFQTARSTAVFWKPESEETGL